MKQHRFSNTRHGLTLVEVVTALLLLGTLMVMLLMTYSKHGTRLRISSENMFLCRSVEELLATWYRQYGVLPINREGTLTISQKDYTWRTIIKEKESNRSLQLGVLQLDVYAPEDTQKSVLTLELAIPSQGVAVP